MQESIFSKIISGKIPAYKLYEDDKTLAFLDIRPSQPGHTLVIPKTQVDHLWDLEHDDYQAVMKTCQKVALHLRNVLHKKRVGVRVEGLDVPHAHVHLIPFDNAREFWNQADSQAQPDYIELAKLAEALKLN